MGWLILVLILIVVVGLIVWLSRQLSGKSTRSKIHGQVCPKCGSQDIRWAGYADRKECAKCGKIFG